MRLHGSSTMILLLICMWGGCVANESDIVIPEHISAVDNLTIYSADEGPYREIELIREVSFGDSSTDLILSRFGYVVVDENGRVFLPDFDRVQIHVFDSTGHFQTSIGGSGRGPGEFSGFNSFPLGVDDQWLYVFDSTMRWLNLFSLETLEFSHIIKPNLVDRYRERQLPGFHSVREDGRILMGFGQFPFENGQPVDELAHSYYHFDRDGSIIPEVVFQENFPSPVALGLPGGIVGELLVSVSYEGRFFSAWSNDFLISVRDSHGEYQHAFYYPFSKKELTLEDALQRYDSEATRERIRSASSLPGTWPVLEDMVVDDENRLWVSTITGDFNIREWWVLEESGELIARFELSSDEEIEVVKNGAAYIRETSPETGLQEIVRYRIEMTEI